MPTFLSHQVVIYFILNAIFTRSIFPGDRVDMAKKMLYKIAIQPIV